MTGRSTGVLAAAVLFCALVAPASAQTLPPYVLVMLQDARDGALRPCNYTTDQLTSARRLVPPDLEQYGELPAAIQAAIDARTRGECSGKKALPIAVVTPGPGSAVPRAVPTGVPTKTVIAKPPEPEQITIESAVAPITGDKPAPAVARIAAATTANDPPTPVVALLIAAALLGAAGLFVFVASRTRRGAEQLAGMRHAWGEFAWRSGGTWADFVDFVRLGR